MSQTSSFTQLKAGDQIADHIRIFAPIGADPAGSVWDAIHAFEGRVAVKIFEPGTATPVAAEVVEEGTTFQGKSFVVCALDAAAALVARPSVKPSIGFEHLYEQLTCRPPLKRNWFPVYAFAAVATLSALWGAGVF